MSAERRVGAGQSNGAEAQAHAAGFEAILAQYDYDLPASAIAQTPAEPRDSSRLLVLDRAAEGFGHHRFRDLPQFLRAGDLLVLNETRVLRARLLGRKRPGGGATELLLVRPLALDRWEALLSMSGRARPEQVIDLPRGFRARLIAPREDASWEVALEGPGATSAGGDVEALLASAGRVPLPPYIRREEQAEDASWYQTVYARTPGAVAAPTAGLHFTPRLLEEIEAAGIATARVTLHVGPGTFRPLSARDWERGELHAERFELPEAAAEAVAKARDSGGRVIAVGTTSARVLESCADAGRRVKAARGETRLFLRPPGRPQVVDALLTNFHLPKTSLLMLVAAFAGRERVLAAYREALGRGYRFFSYGDAMLIL